MLLFFVDLKTLLFYYVILFHFFQNFFFILLYLLKIAQNFSIYTVVKILLSYCFNLFNLSEKSLEILLFEIKLDSFKL